MGFFAPAGTPPDVVAKLADAVSKAAATPEFTARLASVGSVPWRGSGEDLRRFLADDIQRWAGIVQQAGVKAD